MRGKSVGLLFTTSLLVSAPLAARPAPDARDLANVVPTVDTWLYSIEAGEQGRPARPLGGAIKWVLPEDYPAAARKAGRQGTTKLSISVASDDRPMNCTVIEGAGDAEMDAAACSAIKARGRFLHAMDGNGAAVAGRIGFLVHWTLIVPGTAPPVNFPPPPTSPERNDWPRTGWLQTVFPIADTPTKIALPKSLDRAAGETGLDITINKEGRVVGCTATKPSGNAALDSFACTAISSFPFRYDQKCRVEYYCAPRAPLLVQWKGRSGTVLFPQSGRNFQTPKLAKPLTLSAKDYPPKALAEGAKGRVGASLQLNARGVPTACRITGTSGSDALDHGSCVVLLKKARYLPVTDVFGAPIPGRAFTSLNWTL